MFELLTKEEIDVGWWDKYLELLFEFRKERVEALAERQLRRIQQQAQKLYQMNSRLNPERP
ncbi:hypothetical protein PO124_03180 [Bacillus licheniformis]|nr:hypothetical protein [Bacillus licheniformis]